jgi:hypothetical protein
MEMTLHVKEKFVKPKKMKAELPFSIKMYKTDYTYIRLHWIPTHLYKNSTFNTLSWKETLQFLL